MDETTVLRIAAFIVWVVLVNGVGEWAKRRGRWGYGWAFLSVLITPILAGLILLILPKLKLRDPRWKNLRS